MAALTWDDDIKDFFTQRDIGAMRSTSRPFDLGSYDTVKERAEQIYSVVQSGYMPLNGPRWSEDKVKQFRQWIDAGCPKSAA